jgi:N-methylhydantoinase B
VDSGGPGRFRGGLGYEKHIRMLRDAEFMSIADRSILACWGVKGGRAGRPFEVVIDPGGPAERVVDALADAEPVRAGEVIRIRTTGGGGWGDPLERPVEDVVRDLRWGKVSVEGALRDYGVVMASVSPAARPDELEVAFGLDRADSFRVAADSPANAGFDVDAEATEPLRQTMRATRGPTAFFDRGPGFATLAKGATSAHCDWL